jgi:3-methyladenine DNA glycosylase AlkD
VNHAEVLTWLRRRGSQRNIEGMARFGITAPKAFGVSMATMRPLVKRLGRNHDLAEALWQTGWHEARILASFIDEPARVTPAQMDRWARDFNNWAVCDSVCLHLFNRTPHAWKKVAQWSRRKPEFIKRAAFALIAGLTVHDRTAADGRFVGLLPIIERGAADDRNYVKKAVSWALRQVGKRNIVLNGAAVMVARRLAGDAVASRRWVGKDALRELSSAAIQKRLADRYTG